jgi:hypothetical protein
MQRHKNMDKRERETRERENIPSAPKHTQRRKTGQRAYKLYFF